MLVYSKLANKNWFQKECNFIEVWVERQIDAGNWRQVKIYGDREYANDAEIFRFYSDNKIMPLLCGYYGPCFWNATVISFTESLLSSYCA